MITARTSDARAALSDAQSRRTDILKLESTLITLAELTQQVADLVVTQDSQFISIEEAAVGAESDMKAGVQQVGLAKASAAATRHKRKICAAVFLIIVIVIVIVVAVQFSGSGGPIKDSPDEGTPATAQAASAALRV